MIEIQTESKVRVVNTDDANSELPQRNKGLKDQFWIVVFAIILLLVAVFSGYAFRKCIPSRFFRGVDSWGNVCGGSASTVVKFTNVSDSGKLKSEFPYVWTPHFLLHECIVKSEAMIIKICVKTCPELNNSTDFDQEMCLQIFQTNDYDTTSTNINNICTNLTSMESSAENCRDERLRNHSQIAISGRCLPESIVKDSFVTVESYITIWHYVLTDLLTCADIICISVGLAMLGSVFSCIAIIRYPKHAYLHCIIWCIFLTFCSSAYLVYKTWVDFWEPWKTEFFFIQPFYVSAASACFTSACLLVLMLIAWLKRTMNKKARGFMIESSRCLKFIPKLLSQPIWTFFLVANTTLYFLLIVMYTLNCYELEPTENDTQVVVSTSSRLVSNQWVFVIVLIVIYLWCLSILKTGQETLVCGAVYQWYFAKNKQKVIHPISRSTNLLLRYNIGSVVACSFNSSIVHAFVSKFKFKLPKVAPNDVESLKECKSYLSYFSPYSPASIGIHGNVKVTCLCNYDDPAFAIECELPTMRSLCNVYLSKVIKPGENSLNVGQILYKSHKAARWCLRATHMTYVCFSLAIFNLCSITKKDQIYITFIPATLTFLVSYFACGLILSVMTSVIDAIALCFHHDLAQNNGKDKQYYSSRGFVNRITGAKLAETATYGGINRIKRKEMISEKFRLQGEEIKKREEEILARHRRKSNHKVKRGLQLQRIPKGNVSRLSTGPRIHRSRSRVGLNEDLIPSSHCIEPVKTKSETKSRQSIKKIEDVSDILETKIEVIPPSSKQYIPSTSIEKANEIEPPVIHQKIPTIHIPELEKPNVPTTVVTHAYEVAPPPSKKSQIITFDDGRKPLSMWNKILLRGVKTVAPGQVSRYTNPPILIRSVYPKTNSNVTDDDLDDKSYEARLWNEDIW